MATLEALGFSEVLEPSYHMTQGTGTPATHGWHQPTATTQQQPHDHISFDTAPGLATTRDQRSVYVSNLAPSTTREQLQQMFSKFGSILCLTRPVNPETLQPLNHAYVEFATAEQAAAALAAHTHHLEGRALSVLPKRTNVRGFDVFAGHVGSNRRGGRGGRRGGGASFGRQGAAFWH